MVSVVGILGCVVLSKVDALQGLPLGADTVLGREMAKMGLAGKHDAFELGV